MLRRVQQALIAGRAARCGAEQVLGEIIAILGAAGYDTGSEAPRGSAARWARQWWEEAEPRPAARSQALWTSRE